MSEASDGAKNATIGSRIAAGTHHILDHVTDIAAIAGLGYLGYVDVGDGTTQVLAGGMVSVALGKHYLDGRKARREAK